MVENKEAISNNLCGEKIEHSQTSAKKKTKKTKNPWNFVSWQSMYVPALNKTTNGWKDVKTNNQSNVNWYSVKQKRNYQ